MWVAELAAGLPLPDGLYCSPMTRAIRTCQLTFKDIVDFSERSPLILEVYLTSRLNPQRCLTPIRMPGRFMACIHAICVERDLIYSPASPSSRSKKASLKRMSFIIRLLEKRKPMWRSGPRVSSTIYSKMTKGLVGDSYFARKVRE